MTPTEPLAGPLLSLDALTVSYRQGARWLDAVRDVSLSIAPGETCGLVGESGSGKSTLALAIMRYLGPHGAIRAGRITLAGRDLTALSADAMRPIWRDALRYVPQNPGAALNPSLRIGAQLAETLGPAPRSAATGNPPARDHADTRARTLDLLRMVHLADPERVAASYPHQLSGGMQQRIMLAMALSGAPQLLILDEPTTNLDVTTEAVILGLVRELVRAQGAALLYVSHSLGVVAQLCSRTAVLYAGELVEDAPATLLYTRPLHPYTQALLDSVPAVGQRKHDVPLRPIPGRIPALGAAPVNACVFAPRCPLALDLCRAQRPALESAAPGHRVRCHRWREIAAGLRWDDGLLLAESAPHPAPHSAAGQALPAAEAHAERAPLPEPHSQAGQPLPAAEGDAERAPLPETHSQAGQALPAAEADAERTPRPEPHSQAGQPLPAMEAHAESALVLRVTNLQKEFPQRRALPGRPAPAPLRAVDGVSFTVGRARVLGLVGESGSGKTTVARCIIGLSPRTGGEITLLNLPLAPSLGARGRDVLRRVQMVFQNPDESLNPYLTIGESLRRPLQTLGLTRPGAVPGLLHVARAATGLDPVPGGSHVARAATGLGSDALFGESAAGDSALGSASHIGALSGVRAAGDSALGGASHLGALSGVRAAGDSALGGASSPGGLAAASPAARLTRAQAHALVPRLLAAVGLDPAYARRLPGQLSGGEKQRVAIARAFAAQPDLLLFDEAVSALDVSVQAAILNLLNSLQRDTQYAALFISHDLAVVGYLADDVAVMYGGRLMELGPAAAVFAPPYHPYTELLLSAIPRLPRPPTTPIAANQPRPVAAPIADNRPPLQRPSAMPAAERLTSTPIVLSEPGIRVPEDANVPNPPDLPSDVSILVPTGCPFHQRCPRFLGDICLSVPPPWRVSTAGVGILCHIPLDELAEAQGMP